ncbi:SPW repeat domain-containing protein [Halobacterium noricense]|jgi:peptidoglycan/LPS O-acetylase OafA/YrhL|uniref:SPW repeat domain-containing protein n=1 Tax=Halobacterium noricense TaxID=223182 RepID=UPI001E4D93FD|nr:hypothetical protein [Halobacterium noricense]UHH27176.1 hypothetical protein LT974_16120 [Halobacterium noricense]
MKRVVKWAAVLGTIASLWTAVSPTFWQPDHVQVLTNVLLGEFAALALAHTAYRLASEQQPSIRFSLAATALGVLIAASPLTFGLVTGLTTSNIVSGGLIAVTGLTAAFITFRRSKERNLPNALAADEAPAA